MPDESPKPQPAMVIDAHIHLWDPAHLDYQWLAGTTLERRFDVDDLLVDAPSIDGFVVVQADCRTDQALDEIDWVLERMKASPALLGIVAFAPLEQGAAVQPILEQLRATPGVVGVRRLLQDEPDGFGATPDFLAGLSALGELGLPFDACIRERQLPDIATAAERSPSVTFVLDHLGKPQIGAEDWRRDLGRLARLPNVVCKLSGLSTETTDDDPSGRMSELLRDALDIFGPDRCMFASDWPVLTQSTTHTEWLGLVESTLAAFGGGADQVLHATATRVYSLPPLSGPEAGP